VCCRADIVRRGHFNRTQVWQGREGERRGKENVGERKAIAPIEIKVSFNACNNQL